MDGVDDATIGNFHHFGDDNVGEVERTIIETVGTPETPAVIEHREEDEDDATFRLIDLLLAQHLRQSLSTLPTHVL